MKSYSDILLHEELKATQKEVSGVTNRIEYWDRSMMKNFVMPAITGVPTTEPSLGGFKPTAQLSEEEAVARKQVVHFGQVIPIEDVYKVIDMVSSITRMPCGCRFKTIGKTDKRYCFGLGFDKTGTLGKYPDAASSLEVLDKEETKKIFHEYDEEGLMHSIWTGVTPCVIGICNCDRDCGAYKSYIEKDGAPSFFRAEYVCRVDWDLCTGCKSCMSQCQFGSQFYSSVFSKVHIDPTRCFGCGICRAACPHDAIELVPREEIPEAANIWLRREPQIG